MTKVLIYYENVTDIQIKNLIDYLIENGANVKNTGPNLYEVTGHGITSNATYNTDTKILTVEISKPWFNLIPISSIDDGIKKGLGIEL